MMTVETVGLCSRPIQRDPGHALACFLGRPHRTKWKRDDPSPPKVPAPQLSEGHDCEVPCGAPATIGFWPIGVDLYHKKWVSAR